MRTLDRTQPYGRVFPPISGGIYEQDGLLFDVEGKRVEHADFPGVAEAAQPAARAPTNAGPQPWRGADDDALARVPAGEISEAQDRVEPKTPAAPSETPPLGNFLKLRAWIIKRGGRVVIKEDAMQWLRLNGYPTERA